MKDHEHPDANPESVPETVYSFKQSVLGKSKV